MHAHTCRCGAVLTCAVEDCAVFEPYQCPTCDEQERDEFFQAVADPTVTVPNPQLELTYESL